MARSGEDLHYEHFWFLTWTTYGSWLPGDGRGAVGIIHNQHGNRVERNRIGDPTIEASEALQKFSRKTMKGDPVRLRLEHARVLLTQFHCTAGYRRWRILAAAIMGNHIHVGVNVHSDPEPDTVLRDFKSYGSRALNLQWGKPVSGTWWTESGSKRKLNSDNSVLAAVRYTADQEYPLIVWTIEDGLIVPRR